MTAVPFAFLTKVYVSILVLVQKVYWIVIKICLKN